MAGKTKRSIDDIKKLFEERNYKLLSNEYINNVQKLKYICPKHNDVVQSISLNNFLRGAGCKYCGRERSAEKHKKYNIDIIKKLFLKKDYVLLSTEYKDIHSPLEYICNKHKNITQKILLSNFLSGNGCPDCAKERQRHNYQFIKEEFNKRDYTLITQEYVHAHQYLKYICNKHKYLGIQKIKYNKLQQDRGCRACALSKGEKKIAKYLIKNNYYFTQEFVFNELLSDLNNPLRFDFAVFEDKDKTKLKMLIEYDGEFHYKKYFKEQNLGLIQYHDKLKNEYCKKNNIKLFRIPYYYFDFLDLILDKIFEEVKI